MDILIISYVLLSVFIAGTAIFLITKKFIGSIFRDIEIARAFGETAAEI